MLDRNDDPDNRFTWAPDDLLVMETTNELTAARTRVRQAIGDAAHLLSDVDIDGIIAAAQPTAP